MYDLLKDLCAVHSPSGEEHHMTKFLLNYINRNKKKWHKTPEIFAGEAFQDCIVLRFGEPSTAAFAHLDTTGFTVRYQNQLVPIGSPEVAPGDIVCGQDLLGPVECGVELSKDHHLYYTFGRAVQPGTSLSFKPNFHEDGEYLHSCYLDNRAGIYNLLKVAENLEDGLLVFSCWEEHGGGSVPFLVKFMVEEFGVKQALVSDVTWISDGIYFGDGVVVSNRDRNIPRRKYVEKIMAIANDSGIPFQIEVEGSGSSDGREIQLSPYPIDWCFVGAPEENTHSSTETMHKSDLDCMIRLYEVLFRVL